MASADIPTLDELASHPESLAALSVEQRSAVILRCAAVILAASAATPAAQADPVVEDAAGPTLDADEACKLLHKRRRWLFRNAHRLPFVHRVGPRHLVCDEAKLRAWLVAHDERTYGHTSIFGLKSGHGKTGKDGKENGSGARRCGSRRHHDSAAPGVIPPPQNGSAR